MSKTKIWPSVYTNNFRALKKISILNLQYSGLETKEREREKAILILKVKNCQITL